MPIIDVYAPADLVPDGVERQLAERMTEVVMRAEGVPVPAPKGVQDITGFFLHRLPAQSVHTAGTGSARVLRIMVTVGGNLPQTAYDAIIAESTAVAVEVLDDPTLADRTWVILLPAVAGAWGVAGRALTAEDAPRLGLERA